jgi:hypothetical protein
MIRPSKNSKPSIAPTVTANWVACRGLAAPGTCAPRSRRRMQLPLHIYFTLFASVVYISPVMGQPRGERPLELPPLARFAPADTGLFVEVDGLIQLSMYLRERDMWGVVENLLAEGKAQQGWPAALAASLGIESSRDLARLFRERVALAAPDWQHLSQGVLVFSVSNPQALRLVTRAPRAQRVGSRGQVALYRTHGGMWLAQRNQLMVVARHRDPRSFFDRCVTLLNGPAGGSLADQAGFRATLKDLGAPRLAWAYWSAQERVNSQPSSRLTSWWPDLREGALAVRRGDTGIEIALRGTRNQAPDEGYQPRVRVDRLHRLPQLTLAAWATSVDAAEVFEAAAQLEFPKAYGDTWRAMLADADTVGFRDEVLARVGPRCLLCLSANFRKPELDPQFALLIESVDAPAVVTALRRLTTQALARYTPRENANSSGLQLTSENYHGTDIHTLIWPANGTASSPASLAELAARNMTPSIAAADGWVVLATTRDEIREIIDAQDGLTPTLGETIPLTDTATRRSGGVAVLQSALTHSMLSYWGAVIKEGQVGGGTRLRLGIQVRRDPTPGAVVIENITSNGPADGVLRPGDRIVGCNGQLLRLDEPLAHLRGLLAQPPALDKPLTLRVLRDDGFLEANITPHTRTTGEASRGLAALVEELAAVEQLAGLIESLVLAVERPRGSQYRAQLTLRLTGPIAGGEAVTSDSEIPPE